MSVPCHEWPPATRGHFCSEPAVAGGFRYYCIVKSLNKLLLNCAKKCSMVKTKSYGKINSTKSRKSKEWYDTEYNDKRNAFNIARRRYRDNKSEENLKLMKLTGKEYKTIINKSKAVYREKCVEDLKAKESNDPKAFWNIINRTTKHPNTGNVTIDEFFEQFSVLNATEGDDSGLESSSESQIPGNVCNEYSESETLNSPITEDEVSKAVKRLKNGKACGEHYILSIRLRKRAIIWNSTGYHPTTTTNTKLCRSHRNTYTKVRTYHASVASSSLVAGSSTDTI